MSDRTQPLDRDINEYIRHEKDGFERIKRYYDEYEGEFNIRSDFTEFDVPPHGLIAQRAAKIVKFRLDSREEISVFASPKNKLSDMGTAIAIETLLKAVVLEEDPEWFIKETKENPEKPPLTPGFSDCKNKVMRLLPENYCEDQKKRLSQILELIRVQRNNEVHLGFHRISNYREPHQKLQLFLFFFQEYFSSEDFNTLEYDSFMQQLEEAVKDSKVSSNGSIDYPEVNLLDY